MKQHETPQRDRTDRTAIDQAHAPGKHHLDRHETLAAAHDPRQFKGTVPVTRPAGRRTGQGRGH